MIATAAEVLLKNGELELRLAGRWRGFGEAGGALEGQGGGRV